MAVDSGRADRTSRTDAGADRLRRALRDDREIGARRSRPMPPPERDAAAFQEMEDGVASFEGKGPRRRES